MNGTPVTAPPPPSPLLAAASFNVIPAALIRSAEGIRPPPASPERLLSAALLLLTPALAQQFAVYPTGNWAIAQNSTGYTPPGGGGATYPAIFGFYKGSMPSSGTQYDIEFSVPASISLEDWVFYVQSSSTSINNISSPGSITAYVVDFGAGTISKYVSGTATVVAYFVDAPKMQPGNTFHVVNNEDGYVQVYALAGTPPLPVLIASYQDSSPITGGQPGFALAGSSYNQSQLFAMTPIFVLSNVATPPTGQAFTLQSFAQPNRVDLEANAITGVGDQEPIASYSWYRGSTLLATTAEPEFSDVSVSASTNYTYSMTATVFGGYTLATATANVVTPPTGMVDNRLVGVRSTGSYWGGMGEQIDVRSGNLNFSYPLVTAVSRGLSVPIGLSYNSQNWRQDANGNTWQLAAATPGGYGWNAQAGSLQAYYSSATTVHHYEFMDATGAVYHLTHNSSGIWSSTTESAYVWYDSNYGVLHFRDGSYWVMGCTSAGTESDAGTFYPTVIEDSNGNQLS